MAIELQAKQAPMTQLEWSNLKCVFPDHSIMVVTSSNSLLTIQKSCVQVQLQPSIPHPTVCISSRVTLRSWCSCTWPGLSRSCLSSLSSLAHRDSTSLSSWERDAPSTALPFLPAALSGDSIVPWATMAAAAGMQETEEEFLPLPGYWQENTSSLKKT